MLLRGHDIDWDKCRADFETARRARVIVYGSRESCHPPFEKELHGSRPSLSKKIFMLRKRLAHLTSGTPSQAQSTGERFQPLLSIPEPMRNWSGEEVSVRIQASSLALAIQQTADILWSGNSKFSAGWKKTLSFQWVVGGSVMAQCYHSAPLCLKIWRKSTTAPWKCDKETVEAILSLCLWSVHADRRMERKEGATNTRKSSAALASKHCLISFNDGRDGGLSPMDVALWIETPRRMAIKGGVLKPQHSMQDSCAVQGYPVMTLSPWDLFLIEDSERSSDFVPLSPHQPSAAVHGSALARIFGWNAAERLRHDDATEVRFVTTELSLAQMYAQEIFASFIRALFTVVDKIGGTSELKVNPWIGLDKLKLENTEISRVLEVFTDCNLGSPRDALFTTLPAIGS
ncbi:uncharacterized protein EI97DRAFT_30786 [Westerdykella ornata]|uniref:Uncharacterized protein n=1 Tax=Westerdykella ornata TaxID=318751 RepID=A0A6A6JXX8_WESOR|nr:uncharacterized protein EI97DRAFT_30786 [Westerdykella ornata]KAF2281481.1 hypothetical protein EI97DRAFT_30786 [Westerdykella ornata]